MYRLPDARSQTVEWMRQLGTSEIDNSTSISADALGNVYLSGYTDGSLGGPNAGGRAAFISKYDASGMRAWTTQLDSSVREESSGVSSDGLGGIYIAGNTYDANNDTDVFLRKYDASGMPVWNRNFGTSGHDYAQGVAADAIGNVFISGATEGSLEGPHAGGTYDAYLRKYDTTGTLEWTRQLGSRSSDESNGVSVDGIGNVYIAGVTSGNLGGIPIDPNGQYESAFISKYDASGGLQWTQQLGTGGDGNTYGLGVSADGLGNAYISGFTYGSLEGTNAGNTDAFLSKYAANGTLEWTRQLGTDGADKAYGVAADGIGNVYIAGYTRGSLEGTNAGGADAFLSKYDAGGSLKWTRQFGSSGSDYGNGISADGMGSVYMSGSTAGNLEGLNAGLSDAFVARFSSDLNDLRADFDGDGDVDGADFLRWQAAFVTDAAGDADRDGDTDGDDFLIWQSEYQSLGSGAVAPSTSVPEASGVTLGLLVAFAACLARRRPVLECVRVIAAWS